MSKIVLLNCYMAKLLKSYFNYITIQQCNNLTKIRPAIYLHALTIDERSGIAYEI